MLFVFLVDSGTTLPLQMDLALEKVDTLKTVLAKRCGIPVDKQVGGVKIECFQTSL